jgi:DNA-binding XRE family transcriptional regulator
LNIGGLVPLLYRLLSVGLIVGLVQHCLLTERRKKQIQPAFGPEKAFGQALREVRKERNISQEQLALEGEFDRTFPSLIERGLRSPSIRTLVKMADVLRVKPSEIIARMEVLLDSGREREKRGKRKAS